MLGEALGAAAGHEVVRAAAPTWASVSDPPSTLWAVSREGYLVGQLNRVGDAAPLTMVRLAGEDERIIGSKSGRDLKP